LYNYGNTFWERDNMTADLTKVGIGILMDLFFHSTKRDEWVATETMKLMFDTGLFDNADHVVKIIAEQHAEALLPKIYELFKAETLEELANLKSGIEDYE
jgi:hypothetical protein